MDSAKRHRWLRKVMLRSGHLHRGEEYVQHQLLVDDNRIAVLSVMPDGLREVKTQGVVFHMEMQNFHLRRGDSRLE